VGPARDIYVADKMRRFDEQKFAEDVFEQRDSGGDFVRPSRCSRRDRGPIR
jgi:hypothetical protein